MTKSFDDYLDSAFRGKAVDEILAASPAALKGVSEGDADHLDAAFQVRTVRDMVENRFIRRGQAILAAAGTPGFDPGPPPDWEALFAAAPLAHYIGHPATRFRLEFGPVYYRGRLDGSARAIVVGQDPATNEILGHRIFVGQSGQRVQALLHKLGLVRSYAMINTFLYSVFGQFDTELRHISEEAEIMDYRNRLLDYLLEQNPVQAVIAIGSGARHALDNWPGRGSVPVFELVHPAAPESTVAASWNAALPPLQDTVDPDDGGRVDTNPFGDSFGPGDQIPIPRYDLPFGIPDFHGVEGGHGDRDGNDRLIWIAP